MDTSAHRKRNKHDDYNFPSCYSLFLLKLTVKKGEFIVLDELNVTRNIKDFNKWVPDAWKVSKRLEKPNIS